MRWRLSAFGLWFAEPDVEDMFAASFVTGHFRQTRLYMVAAAAIYFLFAFWDLLIGTSSWPATVAIRSLVALGWMLPLTAITLIPGVRRRAEVVLLLFTIVPVWSLSLIYSYLEDGFTHGTAGTILLILYVATLLPMRVPYFAAFSAATWIGFLLGEALWARQPAGHAIVNNISVGTALALSLYAVAAREFSARRQFRTAAELRIAKAASDVALEDLKRMQTQLVQAEKLASLGQLVAGVAHEINTPIGVAITTVTTVEAEIGALVRRLEGGRMRRSDLTTGLDRLGEGARIIFANLDRAGDLVHGFKQVAVDRATEERRSFVVGTWLHDLLTSLKPLIRRHGHSIEARCPEDLRLATYPGALAQVISNLTMNAVTHAFAEGRAGRMTIEVVRIGADGVRLLFRDDGVGIPPENRDRVFDPFFTTRRHQGSTGLGLQIVHNLVTGVLAGRITLSSEVGRGTQFCIDLPGAVTDGQAPGPTGE